MSLTKVFSRKKDSSRPYHTFWEWFQTNEKSFFRVVKEQGNIEKDFFRKLSPKLDKVQDGFYFLTGMLNDHTAELIITADGNVKNMVFVEELVAAAPAMEGWKITAHKPAMRVEDVTIEMDGYQFSGENLSFYSNEYPEYPDEINITVVHRDFNEADKSIISNGTYIFLDNFLGELNFVTTIDGINVIGPEQAKKELVPIEKLKSYLVWRQKEFIEKYEGVRPVSDRNNYSTLEAELENGSTLVAVINRDLLNWDRKASHPWLLKVLIEYEGRKHGGMPDGKTYQLLNDFEDTLSAALTGIDGHLYIGRQTADHVREIYFACKDFREPARVMRQMHNFDLKRATISYELYIDKYWQSFNRFLADF